MAKDLPIHDLWFRSIPSDGSNGVNLWTVLGFNDHVLRRFGCLQVIRVEAGEATEFRIRRRADEVWSLIEGRVECCWQDLRADSPSRDQIYRAELDLPTAVLVPFGVGYGVRATDGPALLLRIMTESEDEGDPPEILAWPGED
jgi:hypothetical protein